MHYHVEVWFPERPLDIELFVDDAIARVAGSGGAFDWYVLGGRWVSAHYPSYEPMTDVENLERCSQCEGKRDRSTCPACKGMGIQRKPSSQWRIPEHVVMGVRDIPSEMHAALLIVFDNDGSCRSFWQDEWTGNAYVPGPLKGKPVKEFLCQIGIEYGVLVTVDAHN